MDYLTNTIRGQSKSIEMIYERTIGNRDYDIIKFNLEKGGLLGEELDGRLENVRVQMEGEMEGLVKEFQRVVNLEKIEFNRKLEEYKKSFYANLEILRKDNTELIAFQNATKYYNNANSFTLKLINESERKSQEWIMGQKRVLQRVNHILDTPGFTSLNATGLSRATKSNLFIFPYWKGEKREGGEV